MALFRQKNVPTIDALVLPDSDYAFVKDGKLVEMPKAEFEAAYEPVPPHG